MSIAEKLTTIAENEQRVYEAGITNGRQAEYDEFWDNYQQNGERTDHQHAFGGIGWNKYTFKPKYDIKPNSAYMMFRYFNYTSTNEPIDLVEHLAELGVTLDFSNMTTNTYLFERAKISRVGVVNFAKCGGIENTFLNCSYIETIEGLVFNNSGSQIWYSAFNGCTNLKNVNSVTGVIGQNANLSACPLTVQSAINFINTLKDYSGTTTTRTLTLNSTTKANLTEADIATITQKGWTLA